LLILGDAAHADDVAWINPFREGTGAIERATESVERLRSLGAAWACSGHGPPAEDPAAILSAAYERYRRWSYKPESAAWHASKRIAAYALIIRGGLSETEATGYFASRRWAREKRRRAPPSSRPWPPPRRKLHEAPEGASVSGIRKDQPLRTTL